MPGGGSNVFLNVYSDKSQDVSASNASFLTSLFLFFSRLGTNSLEVLY